jgi:hypothetical protein
LVAIARRSRAWRLRQLAARVPAILRKLDVRTRGEASAKAAQLGLTGSR